MRKLIVAIAVAFTTATFPPAHVQAEQPAAPQHFTVTTQGSGPDVILIPGLASPRDVYAHEAALLAPHYRLHLVQVNGFGTQPAGANAKGPVLQPVVDELHAYIVAEHLQHPAIIGHSLGGLAALMVAIQHPADVGKVLVVDSLPFIGLLYSPNATVAASQTMAATMRDRMMAESQAEYAAQESTVMARLVKSPGQLSIATGWAAASDRSVVARAMYDNFTTDIRPELGRIKVTVTVLYPFAPVMGAQDKVHELYAQAYAGLSQAKLVQVDASYHFIMLDQPDAFHRAVLAFLQ